MKLIIYHLKELNIVSAYVLMALSIHIIHMRYATNCWNILLYSASL